MIGLKNHEVKKILDIESQLKKIVYLENEKKLLSVELIDINLEIVDLLSKKKKIERFYDFTKLLAKQLQYYDAQDAYIFGKRNYETYINDIFSSYMLEIDQRMQKEDLEIRIQYYFTELLDYLGLAKGLLYDFTETFRAVYGVLYNHIKIFLDMGKRYGEYEMELQSLQL